MTPARGRVGCPLGSFSWDCNICGASLHHAWEDEEDPDAWRMDSVLVAENGVMAEGDYNGSGCIGSFQIPKDWMENYPRFYRRMLAMAERDALQADTVFETIQRAEELIRRYNPEDSRAPSGIKNGDHWRKRAAEHRASLDEALKTFVAFSVYHRRCWEQGGRPGFTGMSKESEDQGG